MSALTFDKSELGNLEYSLQREMLSTDRIGGYMSTTIVCCNTRRYHGLMVAPIDDSGRTYVLLSSLDETVVQHDQTFNLALHRFKGVYEPRGHKYITDFEYTPTRGRRNPQEGDALDPQADAADDPLHARGRPLRNPAAAAAVPRLPRQACADARQHGGRRTLLPRRKRREVPSLQLVPVALSPDEQTRHGVRARARLVLRIRIPAGAGPRIRGVRRPAHDGLFRSGAQEGREHHLLGVARRNGLDQNHRRGFRRIHRAAYA